MSLIVIIKPRQQTITVPSSWCSQIHDFIQVYCSTQWQPRLKNQSDRKSRISPTSKKNEHIVMNTLTQTFLVFSFVFPMCFLWNSYVFVGGWWFISVSRRWQHHRSAGLGASEGSGQGICQALQALEPWGPGDVDIWFNGYDNWY